MIPSPRLTEKGLSPVECEEVNLQVSLFQNNTETWSTPIKSRQSLKMWSRYSSLSLIVWRCTFWDRVHMSTLASSSATRSSSTCSSKSLSCRKCANCSKRTTSAAVKLPESLFRHDKTPTTLLRLSRTGSATMLFVSPSQWLDPNSSVVWLNSSEDLTSLIFMTFLVHATRPINPSPIGIVFAFAPCTNFAHNFPSVWSTKNNSPRAQPTSSCALETITLLYCSYRLFFIVSALRLRFHLFTSLSVLPKTFSSFNSRSHRKTRTEIIAQNSANISTSSSLNVPCSLLMSWNTPIMTRSDSAVVFHTGTHKMVDVW